MNTNSVTDISSLSTTTTLVEPVYLTASGFDYNITVRLRGNTPTGNGGDGGYVQGTFTVQAGSPIDFIMTTDILLSSMEQEQNLITVSCSPQKVVIKDYLPPHILHHIQDDHQNLMVVMLDILLETTGASLNNSGGGTGATTSGYRSWFWW